MGNNNKRKTKSCTANTSTCTGDTVHLWCQSTFSYQQIQKLQKKTKDNVLAERPSKKTKVKIFLMSIVE